MSRMRATILAGAAGAMIAGTAIAPAAAAPGARAQQSAVGSARTMLAQAEAELAEARQTAAAVRRQAAHGSVTPQVLAALAQNTEPAYRTGAPEIDLIAGMLSDDSAETTLAQATIDDLSDLRAPEVAPAVPETPVVLTTPQQAVRAAEARVTAAKEKKDTAEALIRQLSGQQQADGPGATKLARLCAEADVVVSVCEPVRWSEAHLVFDTVMIGRTVNVTWDAVKEVGGYRPYDPYPDHPSGRAADIMMPNGGAGSDVELGNEIARYFQKHADEYGIYYMIWRQRMWKNGDPVGAWTGMSDRGSPTANHMDHVHITVTGDTGAAWPTLLREARRSAKA